MEYVLYCLDKPASGPLRQSVRMAHLEHALRHARHFLYGGPLLGPAGDTQGSLLVMDFDSREQLDAYVAHDPYFGAGLFQSVAVWPSRRIFPESRPGALAGELERQRAADAAAPPPR